MRRPLTALAATTIVCGVLAMGAIAGGCAFDWGFPSDDSLDAAGDRPVDGSNLPDAFKEGSPGDTSPPPPPPADCKESKECGPNSYCHFADHACGTLGTGKCAALPGGCPGPAWVCGCNNMAYKDECLAAADGFDLGASASCGPQSGLFRCGTLFCEAKKTFCVESSKTGIVEYSCPAFDAACGLPGDCMCSTVKNLGCVACNDSTAGEVTVTCKP